MGINNNKKTLFLLCILLILTSCHEPEKHYDEWVIDNGKTYYYDENGQKKTGWFLNKDNNWLYFTKDGCMVENQRKTIEGKTYFFDQSGNMVCDQAKEINGKTYYYAHDGAEYKGLWEKKYYVDKFGDKTENAYICNHPFFKDKNKDFEYEIIIDDKNVSLIIHNKKANNKVDAYLQFVQAVLGDQKYECQLKTDDGYEVKFTGQMGSKRIIVDSIGTKEIINCLKTKSAFKVYIEEKSISELLTSTYLFEVDADNFKYVYWK